MKVIQRVFVGIGSTMGKGSTMGRGSNEAMKIFARATTTGVICTVSCPRLAQVTDPAYRLCPLISGDNSTLTPTYVIRTAQQLLEKSQLKWTCRNQEETEVKMEGERSQRRRRRKRRDKEERTFDKRDYVDIRTIYK